MPISSLTFAARLPIRASHAGLYVCPGEGRHDAFKLETFELILVRNGCLRMDEEGRQFTVESGQTLLLFPQRRHGGVGVYEPETEFYWLHFHLNTPAGRQAGEKITVPQTGTPRRPERLFELFHRYLHDFQGSRSPGIAADLLACEILWEASALQQPVLSLKAASLAGKAKAVMDAGFHRKLTPGEVATELGYSLDYLGARFHAVYNQTLGQYLLQRRMEEARLLLRTGTLRVKEIAAQCGFQSEQYLCRVFRKHEGISPAAYRALHSRIFINVR